MDIIMALSTGLSVILVGGVSWILHKMDNRKKLEALEELDDEIRDVEIAIYEVEKADIYNDKRHFELLMQRGYLRMQKRHLFL